MCTLPSSCCFSTHTVGRDDAIVLRGFPTPSLYVGGDFYHVDAVNRARFDTQIAACALLRDDGMHQLGCPQDGIDRTSLDTLGAANAFSLSNECDGFRLFDSVFAV